LKKKPIMKDSNNKNQPKVSAQQTGKKVTIKERPDIKKSDFALGKENFILLAVGAAFIIFGFILMAIKGEIYGFRKLHLSTIFVIFGFLFEIYAIMKRHKEVK
jgi:hypothetical protein